jgi:hypothetical protein
MRKLFKILMLFMFSLFLMAGTSFALNFGANITTYDGMGVLYEDSEVEPNCVWNQNWDLEAFFLSGTLLTVAGGFDFNTGYQGVSSGDLFIDIDGDIRYGPTIDGSGSGNQQISNSFGYDYVIDLDFSSLSYDVYKIDQDATLLAVFYQQNQESNAWAYYNGGGFITSGGIDYYDEEYDIDGLSATDSHDAFSIDLAFLGTNIDNFTAHITQSCGNDNLMGSTVPEPSTFLLMGMGLIGFAVVGRRGIFKK